jgi:hypothetical protein
MDRQAQRQERSPMYARVVRFTDVDPESMEGRGENGPPEGVSASKVQFMHDPEQRTAVVVQFFETAEDMSASEAALSGMDPSETPGTRASVDRCEITMEMKA